jgi:hypothetical protein
LLTRGPTQIWLFGKKNSKNIFWVLGNPFSFVTKWQKFSTKNTLADDIGYLFIYLFIYLATSMT